MNDEVAPVTGASSGVGTATAEVFAARGARLVVAARQQDELASLVRKSRSARSWVVGSSRTVRTS
jgi:NADP-dependent 3-hydroxy acid dehydrogenase YdfG